MRGGVVNMPTCPCQECQFIRQVDWEPKLREQLAGELPAVQETAWVLYRDGWALTLDDLLTAARALVAS